MPVPPVWTVAAEKTLSPWAAAKTRHRPRHSRSSRNSPRRRTPWRTNSDTARAPTAQAARRTHPPPAPPPPPPPRPPPPPPPQKPQGQHQPRVMRVTEQQIDRDIH